MLRLLIVAGHAIYDRSTTINSYFDLLYPNAGVQLPAECYWHGFEADKFPGEALKQMVCVVEQHVRYACTLVHDGRYDVIVFSGGKTRGPLHEQPNGDPNRQGIKNSEASGMEQFASDVGCLPRDKYIVEPCASDSFTNVLYSILACHKAKNEWPDKIGVVSMPHKATRFFTMGLGLGFDLDGFEFHGCGTIPNTEYNLFREIENMATLIDRKAEDQVQDPLLRDSERFEKKRAKRLHPDCDPHKHYGNETVRSEALEIWERAGVGRNDWGNCLQNWPWNKTANKAVNPSGGSGVFK